MQHALLMQQMVAGVSRLDACTNTEKSCNNAKHVSRSAGRQGVPDVIGSQGCTLSVVAENLSQPC